MASFISVARVGDDGKIVYVRIPLDEAFGGAYGLNMAQFDLVCKLKNLSG